MSPELPRAGTPRMVARMRNASDHPPICRLCGRPMTLERILPKVGAMPEILVYHCALCNEVETNDQQAA
jgi:hypothetical protein